MQLPSVVLHDHLDGGLRPATVVELAAAVGHVLPADDPDDLADWFDQGRSGSLERYLEAFVHTVSVMQTAEAITRVAREAVEDLAADGVVYAEIRFAPHLLTRRGLSPDAVVEAALSGMAAGAAKTGMDWGLILDAMRQDDDSLDVARLAVRHAGHGVVGFDLAGPEAGFPPDRHLAAIRHVQEAGLHLTLHAGEAGGLASLASAMHRCRTERIGHGVEVIDDCTVRDGEIVSLGPLAADIRDRRLPLEICVSSNLHTKGWLPGDHPVGMLHRAGFAVTLNTDNRLMSRTSMSAEFELVRRHQGFDVDDLLAVTRTALDAAFCPVDVKRRLWEDVILPAYRSAGARGGVSAPAGS